MLNATDEIRYSAFDSPVTVSTRRHPQHNPRRPHPPLPTSPRSPHRPSPPSPPTAKRAQTLATPSGRQPPPPSRRDRHEVERLLTWAVDGPRGRGVSGRAV